MMTAFFNRISIIFFAFCFVSCGGGGGLSDSACNGACENQFLSRDEALLILGQAIAEASSKGVAATISITDRVGNVLLVYQMLGASTEVLIDGQLAAVGGLEGAIVPSALVAISKAGTGAFLSSQGNAFTSRTASQIIQEHFAPGELRQPGGPLFGVQFSQLICSDITRLESSMQGPRPLPLGLSADPGGIPLYKSGSLVGGIGVEVDALYSLDRNIQDRDNSIEETVALAGARGFEPDVMRRADRIFVLGKSLRFTDVDAPNDSAGVGDINPENFVTVSGFFDGEPRSGVTFGSIASGIAETVRAGMPAAQIVNGEGATLYPTQSGTPLAGGIELQSNEVDAILDAALLTAFRSRAAIRRPLDTSARVSIWVVDTEGVPLGFVRSQDAPVFGIDVALQKARTATFFSSQDAGDALRRVAQSERAAGIPFEDYVGAAKAFIGEEALTGSHAFADRSGGNLSRPFFPDGIDDTIHGPFSLPFPRTSHAARSWSPFNTGLQLDLVLQRVLAPLGGVIPATCTDSQVLGRRLANGIQIFPGSVPLYRNGVLIGGIGVSGDGIDQDDLISFYGVSRRGLDAAGHTSVGDPQLGFNAPKEIRADTLTPQGVRLRYVNCPEAPFIGSNEQGVCDDL